MPRLLLAGKRGLIEEAGSESSNVTKNAHLVVGASQLAENATAMGFGTAEEERLAGVDNNLQICFHDPHTCL